MAGRCEWRTSGGFLTGNPPELPREQLAAGLAVGWIGGLMAGGAWEPSKAIDSIFTAGAGFLLLATAWDDNYVRETVHVDTDDGRRLTTCPGPGHWSYSSFSWDGVDDGCTRDSFSRLHMMWSGFAALGLAVGRALWRDGPPLEVEVGAGRVSVGKTIEF